MKKAFCFALTVSVWCTSRADFYQGIRQMGMGGAAVAVVNDETSLLLNPIGLGRLREPITTLFDPEVTTNADSLKTVQDLGLDAIEVDQIYTELGGRQDQRYFVRGQMFPSFVDRNYGLGILAKYDITAIRSSANQFLNLNYVSDWAAVGGYNHSFFGGQVKVGIAGRYIDRVEYRGDIDPSTQALDIETLASGGTGAAVDAGVSVTSPTDWLPTLSVMVKDIGDTSFTLGNSLRDYPDTITPSKVDQTVDVGIAMFPIWSKATRGALTVEYDDVLEDGDAERKLHFGFEINWFDQMFFRGGWNRGYPTAGFEWAGRFFQLQLAYYGEEIGTDEAPLQDERYAIKAVFRF